MCVRTFVLYGISSEMMVNIKITCPSVFACAHVHERSNEERLKQKYTIGIFFFIYVNSCELIFLRIFLCWSCPLSSPSFPFILSLALALAVSLYSSVLVFLFYISTSIQCIYDFFLSLLLRYATRLFMVNSCTLLRNITHFNSVQENAYNYTNMNDNELQILFY